LLEAAKRERKDKKKKKWNWKGKTQQECMKPSSEAERETQLLTVIPGQEIVSKELVEECKEMARYNKKKKYRPEMCERVIEILSQGRTKMDAAALLGIHPSQITRWCDAESDMYVPEFAEAVELGEALSGLWWREQGRLNLGNKYFNSTLFMMNMQNRFGWTRKLEGNITKITEDRKVLEINIGERSAEHVGEVLRILHTAGAITAEPEEPTDSEIN
jgi:hypothetical protein